MSTQHETQAQRVQNVIDADIAVHQHMAEPKSWDAAWKERSTVLHRALDKALVSLRGDEAAQKWEEMDRLRVEYETACQTLREKEHAPRATRELLAVKRQEAFADYLNSQRALNG